MSKELRLAIERTIKFLHRHKWGKGYRHNGITGAYCLLGAFEEANAPHGGSHILENSFVIRWHRQFGDGVAAFNDHYKTRKHDVMARLQAMLEMEYK